MSSSITRPGVVVPVRLDPTGRTGPTPGQARGSRWRRVAAGLYLPAGIDPTVVDQRIVEAVVGCGPGAAATGWAALSWQRARWFTGLADDGRSARPVPVALGDRPTVRPRAGVVTSEDWRFPDDVMTVDGLPLTIPERSVTYEVRRAPSLAAAVRAIDMAAADDLVDLASMTAYLERLAGRPGTRRVRAAIAGADENAWSPQEALMRVHWRRAFPAATLRCNAPVFDRHGRHLLTPDLLDPVHGVVGEYDGAIHLEERHFRRDLQRDACYRDLGLELVSMMSADRRDVTDFLARLRAAYRRAAAREGASRPWTLEQPDWWVDTSSVARRRALDAHERAVWLRRQAS